MKIGQLAVNKNLKLRVVMISATTSLQTQSFLWQEACAWRAHGLHVSPSVREPQIIVWLCVTSVCKSMKTANPAAGELRATRRKFARQALARKLRFSGGALSEPRPSWLQVTKAQVRRRPARASVARCLCDILHTLANLTTWLLLRQLLEDSNLVDPASSHMLV